MKIFLFTCLLLITNYQLLIAEVRYVSHNGSSTPPYTSWATAADSIQKAINICNDGDSVIVDNGIYYETLLVDKAITLTGMSMDSTIIDGTGLDGIIDTNISVDIRSDCTMENFYILGRALEPLTVAIFERFVTLNLRNCIIEQAWEGIGLIDGPANLEDLIIQKVNVGISTGCLTDTCNFEITKSLILINKLNGIGINNEISGFHKIENNLILGGEETLYDGIEFFFERAAIVKNNLVSGFSLSNYDGSNSFDSTLIYNNVFMYPEEGKGLDIFAGSRTKVRNNIIANQHIGIDARFGDTLRPDYNLYWQNDINAADNVIMGEKDIVADPMFVNDSLPYSMVGDFHLQAFSPAIDAGDPAILDVDGSRSDIGMFGGPLGDAYSYIDLPPRPPKNIQSEVISDSNKIIIVWDFNTEADFSHYLIYRDTTSGFTPDSSNFYFNADTSYFEDYYFLTINNLYYKIISVDNQNNESEPGDEVEIILVGVSEPVTKILNQYLLYQNYPNPFNPTTTIGYSLKERGEVKIKIYNITGELIQTIDERWKEAGYYEVEFNSLSASGGQGLSSGIYLYRIEVVGEGRIPRFSDMKKMILLK